MGIIREKKKILNNNQAITRGLPKKEKKKGKFFLKNAEKDWEMRERGFKLKWTEVGGAEFCERPNQKCDELNKEFAWHM